MSGEKLPLGNAGLTAHSTCQRPKESKKALRGTKEKITKDTYAFTASRKHIP